eukprot:GEMP01051798.1.p1 GENE.GEMP01051798.1~~GEMP01051798.1.p1  ORF type:complete len:272 (+),score=53.05 GEMP01051798.1:52-867(+)
MADKKRRWGKKEKTDVPMGSTTFATPQRAGRNIASEYAGVLRNHKSQLDMISQSGMQREMTLAKVLDDNAFYIQESVCRQDDLSFYSALLEELEFKDAWMKGGSKLHRPTAAGNDAWERSPTYRKIVEWMVKRFDLTHPIKSLVNFYRDGDDWTSYHQDQHCIINFTAGISFGATRQIVFNLIEDSDHSFRFPQYNGDCFAFSSEVNDAFKHSVPKESHPVGGRISVICFARREIGRPIPSIVVESHPYVVFTDPNKPPAVEDAKEEEIKT